MWQTALGDHGMTKHVDLKKMQVTSAHRDYQEYQASGGGNVEENTIDLHIHFVGQLDVSVTISSPYCLGRSLASPCLLGVWAE